MKFTVTMKDPDTLQDAIEEAVKRELEGIEGLDDNDREDLLSGRKEKIGSVADKWFSYGEYLIVEIDTEAKTCIVLEDKG